MCPIQVIQLPTGQRCAVTEENSYNWHLPDQLPEAPTYAASQKNVYMQSVCG